VDEQTFNEFLKVEDKISHPIHENPEMDST
jgi:hypothetical protein